MDTTVGIKAKAFRAVILVAQGLLVTQHVRWQEVITAARTGFRGITRRRVDLAQGPTEKRRTENMKEKGTVFLAIVVVAKTNRRR
jgi:hypothetical protein